MRTVETAIGKRTRPSPHPEVEVTIVAQPARCLAYPPDSLHSAIIPVRAPLRSQQDTIDDFIAGAQYLIENTYASARSLSGEGTSVGRTLIGGAITQRPDLFAGALIPVGCSNALRMEFTPNGPPNIVEFGSVTDADGFRGLYDMDAYQHVKDGVAYPGVLLTADINDPRVDPMQPDKMTARLEAATSSKRPVLLRVDYDAGHGMGSARNQHDLEFADEMSFLLWQFADPEFQPK